MRILVGSTAAKFWFSDFRTPGDIDYFSDAPVGKADIFWHPGLLNYFYDHGPYERIATPDVLYTIKVSHAFWDLDNGSWFKHMNDIMFFQSKGVNLIPELYDLLYSIWEERYGKKKAKLNVPASDFFNNRVTRIYDHDSIHNSVAYNDRPLYEYILREGEDVAVDRSLFNMLSFEDQLRLVREEVYATALERLIIPARYRFSPRVAYAAALRQTITSFSKGWFALFIVENYTDLHKPDVDYVQRHKDNSNKLLLLEDA